MLIFPMYGQIFKDWLEDPKYKKVWHNYGFDRHILSNEGIELGGFAGALYLQLLSLTMVDYERFEWCICIMLTYFLVFKGTPCTWPDCGTPVETRPVGGGRVMAWKPSAKNC